MVRTASFRRFHEQLKKMQIKRQLKNQGNKIDLQLAEDAKYVGRMAHTPHPCSCEMCCNLRRLKASKKDQLSIQEKRANLSLMEQDYED